MPSRVAKNDQLIDLARRASVGIANARATMTAAESTMMFDAYLEDAAKLGVRPCEAWAVLSSVSLAWMAELTRVLAEERHRSIGEEFENMGRLAAGLSP